jgi:hypothetical protein
MVHGQEREAERRRDYYMTELMALGARMNAVEDRLAEVKATLTAMELRAGLTPTYPPVGHVKLI